ncbi:hypothetical protein FACS1894162_1800 [Bacteroidia bacterium]|nr:hypothetical protein FACS1894162_1800 [Bacteroidia bacterium]
MTKIINSEQENIDIVLSFKITEDADNIYILGYTIPKSNNKENFKVREQIVWSIYGQWQALHEEKKRYNIALKSDILIRFEGISETVQKAARNYKYTMAMCAFDQILQYAVEVKRDKPKTEVENQRRYKELIIMNLKTAAFKPYFENIKMTVGVVRSDESKKIQYCITTIEQ